MALNVTGATNFTLGGSTTVASLDASGVYFLTNRPYFWVSQSASGNAVGSDVIFNLVGQNVGGYYNSTNGRFTAPVTGSYHFTYRQLPVNASIAGNYVFALYINGAGSYLPSYDQKRTANTWHSNAMSTVIRLSANDYVTVRYIAGNSTTYTDSNYCQFSGHLVG